MAKIPGAKIAHVGVFQLAAGRARCRTVFAGGPEGKSVLGYQAADGELAWSAGEGMLSYCSPQLARLDGVDQLLIATEAGLTAFVPESRRSPLEARLADRRRRPDRAAGCARRHRRLDRHRHGRRHAAD